MKIVDVSIRQPVFITMVVILVVVLGFLSYSRLGVDLLPDLSLPIVAVTTVSPGMGPEEIEAQITRPVEDAISSINGMKKVSSTSAEGVSVALAEFVLEKDGQLAATEVREKVAAIRNTLPRDVLEPVIEKFDPSASPIVSYNIINRGEGVNLSELRQLVKDQLKTVVERVNGVGSVSLLGGLEREIQVRVNMEKLQALNLSLSQVTGAIRAENINLPAGRITQRDFDFLVRTNAEFRSVDEINAIVVAAPAGLPVYVRDVATVVDGFKTRRTISRVNGIECVSLVVRKQSGTNTVKVADQVRRVMDRLQKQYPELDIRPAADESINIKESRNDVINSFLEGVILTGLVVLLSFGDLRNSLITIAGLPVCTLGVLFIMYLSGFTVNVITLLALSLSIGLIVDDAIVVRENIFRHMEQFGKSPRQAALDATKEVGLAVLATSFTLVAVFLPIAFTTGIAGKFFKPFGVTVAAAILLSLVEAFTLAPMLSAYFFRKADRGAKEGWLQHQVSQFYQSLADGYLPMLRWSVGHRGLIVLITTAVFAASIYLFTLVGFGGSPRGERAEFNLAVQCTSGSSLESTERTVRGIEAILRAQPEIGDLYTVIGAADGASDEASINVRLNIKGQTKQYQDRIRPLLAGIPGAAITFQEASSLGGAAASTLRQLPVQINLRGSDLDDLTRSAEIVSTGLAGIPGLVDINTDYRQPKPEIRLLIDRDRAARLGVNTLQVASTLRSAVDGDVSSKFRAGEKQIDIRVRAGDDVREDLDRLSRLRIPLMNGSFVALDQVAQLSAVSGPTQIKRSERTRQIVVAANIIKGTALNEIQRKVEEKFGALNLPPTVSYNFGGEVEQSAESFTALFISLLLAILFVYMVLASQFESYVQPFSIMLALPLAIIGAVVGLLVGNKLFDTVAFIGVILLMGLVTKNSILLVDFTNVLRKRGLSRTEAILQAGATRLRPIIMTTLATILGMVPVAFSIGTSSDFRAPIGYTIIGGLVSSTLLTLVIVPVAYSIIDDTVIKVRGWFGKK